MMNEQADFLAFESTFHALARKVADALRDAPRPQISGWNIAFSDDGNGVSMSDGLIEEPEFLIGNHSAAIRALDEYSASRCVTERSLFLRRNLSMDNSTGEGFNEDVYWQSISGLLVTALADTFVYRAEEVTLTLQRLRLEISKTTNTFVMRAYFRFAGPRVISELPFTNLGTIRPMGVDERTDLVKALRFFLDAGLTASVAAMFRTVFELRFESDENLQRVKTPRALSDYQTALRLAVGRLAFAFATVEIESVFRPGFYRVVLPYQKILWHGDELAILPEVELRKDDVDRAVALLERLDVSPNARSLSTAMRRFNDALERSRLDDALIDCVVGLESVLTATEKDSTEVGRRLRQRLAFIIGRSPTDRENVYKAFPRIYGARSGIAHGRESTSSLSRLLEQSEEFLSRLLSRLLEDSEAFEPSAVDIAIIRGDGICDV